MAIRWGGSSGYISLGIDLFYSGNPDSGSVSVTAVYYIKADGYGHNFSSTLHRSGAVSGSVGYSFYSPTGGNTVKELSRHTFQRGTAYGSATHVSVSASTGPIWNGGQPSVSASISIPARRFELPYTPSNVRAVRASDSVINLSWSLASDAAHPVHAQGIERWSASSGQWVRVASLGGSERAWADTSVQPGDLYAYRVWGDNGRRGQMGESGRVATTPPAPRNVTAAKTASGAIEVSWESTAPYVGEGFVVYDNGAEVGSAGASLRSWTHQSPSTSVTHSYMVAMRGLGGLLSARSAASNIVQLLAAPGVPQTLAPQEAVRPGSVQLRWRHASLDTTPQTRAEVRYRKSGTSSWAVVVASTDQSRSVSVSVGVYEWQVRTWGAYRPGQESGASPWSAIDRFTVADLPVVGVRVPGGIVRAASTSVEWTYHQAQGCGQGSARVELVRLDGNDPGSTVETLTVNGAARSVPLNTHLPDGSQWQVRVVASSSVGLESAASAQVFTVDYPEPPSPQAFAEWDDHAGCVRVRIVNPAAGGGQAAAVSNRLSRSVDGGATWAVVAADLALNASVTDPLALSHGATFYRVEALTADGASASVQVEALADSQSLWLSGGPGFAVCVGLEYDPVHTLRAGLVHRTVRYFAGRRLGVEMSGMQQERSLSLSATLLDEDWESIQRLEALAQMPGPFLYRDPMGRQIFCSLTGVEMSRALSGAWAIKASIEEVSRD